jgi:hypothetical protein
VEAKGERMSYKYWKHDVEEVRKVNWDGLWHVVYKDNRVSSGLNYDRVPRKEAMYVVKNMAKWRREHLNKKVKE